MRRSAFALSVGLALSACTAAVNGPVDPLGFGPEPSTIRYTPPGVSRLRAVRPFPTPRDVCVVVGESRITAELLDDSATLIGCPKHERGAIGDRMAEGAEVVAHARHWTLLSVPN